MTTQIKTKLDSMELVFKYVHHKKKEAIMEKVYFDILWHPFKRYHTIEKEIQIRYGLVKTLEIGPVQCNSFCKVMKLTNLW